jgi:hypothetical protein
MVAVKLETFVKGVPIVGLALIVSVGSIFSVSLVFFQAGFSSCFVGKGSGHNGSPLRTGLVFAADLLFGGTRGMGKVN